MAAVAQPKTFDELYEVIRGTGWWIEVEPEIRLGDRLFDPELAGWRVERVPELPEENPSRSCRIASDEAGGAAPAVRPGHRRP